MQGRGHCRDNSRPVDADGVQDDCQQEPDSVNELSVKLAAPGVPDPDGIEAVSPCAPCVLPT